MARYTYIPNRVIDSDGISDGANIYFYLPGTTTPVSVFSDAALSVAVSNPYPIAAGAAVPALYYAEDLVRVKVVDSAGATVSDDDPYGVPSAAVVFDPDYSGGAARTVESKLSDFVNVLDFGADSTAASDSSTAFSNALALGKPVYVPAGEYLLNISLPSGAKIIGEGRETTIVRNFGNSPVFTIDNTSGTRRGVHLEGLYIRNRDKTVYTAADGIYINGASSSNENDYHTFIDLTCFQFRYGVHQKGRTIWNRWVRCAFIEAINDGFFADADENQALHHFDTCRWAANGRFGLHIDQNFASFLAAGWTFINGNWENNLSIPVRITGTLGVQNWTFLGCYSEENASSISASATNPPKVGFLYCDSVFAYGLNFLSCTFAGNTAPTADPDYYIYVDTATTTNVMGRIDNCRGDTAVISSVEWQKNLSVGRIENMSLSIDRTDGSVVESEFVSDITPATYTGTLTGCTTSPTGTVRYTKQGNHVMLFIPTINGTSNTTDCTVTGAPAAIFPTRAQTIPCITQDATAGIVVATATIGTDGVITLFTDAGGGVFASTGTKGIRYQTLSYSVE